MKSQSLANEMTDINRDNIETLKGVGASRDITEMEGYDPKQRVGTENDFSRDFNARGASRSTQTGGSATEDIINTLPPGAMEEQPPTPSDAVKPPTGTFRNPVYTEVMPARRIDTGQVLVGQSAIRVVFDADERLSVVLVNRDAANAVYIGANSAVTIYGGFALGPGESVTVSANCELWAVAGAGLTALVSTLEYLQ
jgi:hypothetical protein